MEDGIDRQTFCERVGISQSTLSRWVAEKIVVPGYAGSRPRQVFTEQDTRFGRALKYVLDNYPGEYSLQQMVEIVRNERKPAKHSHSPPGAPPAPGQYED